MDHKGLATMQRKLSEKVSLEKEADTKKLPNAHIVEYSDSIV